MADLDARIRLPLTLATTLAVSLAVTLAPACGGDDPNGDGSTDASTPSTGAAADDDGVGTSADDANSTTANATSADGSTSGANATDDAADTGATTGPVGGPAGSCGMGGGTGEILQITMGSPDRWYLIGAYDTDEPLPLVVAFHGDEGDPFNSTRYIWGSYWEQEQPPFIAVMTKCPGCTSWYQGDTSLNADYVWEVLADVAANHNVDVSRIYAVGYSGGSEFLAIHGWEFQDVFAGIQWSCGGNAYTPYVPPSRPDCKVRGRIVISADDFLWDGAQNLLARLQTEGHEYEYVDAQCSGHCCDTPDQNVGAWGWFQTITKCGAVVPGECADIGTLPPAAMRHEPRTMLATPALPARSGPRDERPAPSPAPVAFADARAEFDAVLAELTLAATGVTRPSGEQRQQLLSRAVAAYDGMLASAHAHGQGAKQDLTERYPRLRASMAAVRQP